MLCDYKYQGVEAGNLAGAAIIGGIGRDLRIKQSGLASWRPCGLVTKISQQQLQIVGRSIRAVHAESS